MLCDLLSTKQACSDLQQTREGLLLPLGQPAAGSPLAIDHWIQLDKGLRFVNQTELFHPSSPPYPRIDFVPPIDSARVPPSLVCLEQISRSQPHPGHMLVKRHVRVRTLPTFVQQFVGFFARLFADFHQSAISLRRLWIVCGRPARDRMPDY